MKKLGVIVLFTVIFSGCASNLPASTPTITATSSPTATQRFIPGTSTFTPSPTITPTHTPTNTPYPTIIPELAFERLISLSGTECRLPCVWGMKPGITPVEEINRLYVPLGTSEVYQREDDYLLNLRIPGDQEGKIIGSTIALRENIVTEIRIPLKSYNLDTQLEWWEAVNHLGKPDEILFTVDKSQDDNFTSYQFLISYNLQGVYVLFEGDGYRISENISRFCFLSKEFLEMSNIYFITFLPDKNRMNPSSTIIDFGIRPNYSGFDNHQTKMTASLFYNSYLINNEDVCFDVTISENQ